MTNEEIINRGGDDMLEQLWRNNKGFIRQQAYRWSYTGRGSGTASSYQAALYEDLVQCGFLAVDDAVKHYDSEKGLFITVLGYYVKKHFRRWCASMSGWTVHQYDELEKNHIKVDSLNRPVRDDNSDDDTELGDLIPDSEDHVERLIDRLYNESLHNKLEQLLNRLDESEAVAVRLRYYDGKTHEQIGEIMKVSSARAGQILRAGIYNLRKLAIATDLADYIDRRTDFYTRVSVRSFQNTNTSAVELIVMRREEILNDLLNKAKRGGWVHNLPFLPP